MESDHDKDARQLFNDLLETYANPVRRLRIDLAKTNELFDDEESRESRKEQLIKQADKSAKEIQAYIEKHFSAYLKPGGIPWHLRALKDITRKRKGLQELLVFIDSLNRTTKNRERYYQTKHLASMDAIQRFNREAFGITKLFNSKRKRIEESPRIARENFWPLSLIQINSKFFERAAKACDCSEIQIKLLIKTLRDIGILKDVLDRPGKNRLTLISDGYFIGYEGGARKQSFFIKADYAANRGMRQALAKRLTGDKAE